MKGHIFQIWLCIFVITLIFYVINKKPEFESKERLILQKEIIVPTKLTENILIKKLTKKETILMNSAFSEGDWECYKLVVTDNKKLLWGGNVKEGFIVFAISDKKKKQEEKDDKEIQKKTSSN